MYRIQLRVHAQHRHGRRVHVDGCKRRALVAAGVEDADECVGDCAQREERLTGSGPMHPLNARRAEVELEAVDHVEVHHVKHVGDAVLARD